MCFYGAFNIEFDVLILFFSLEFARKLPFEDGPTALGVTDNSFCEPISTDYWWRECSLFIYRNCAFTFV